MWLPDAVLKDVRDHGARVFYLSYPAARRWAEDRPPGEPLVFSGWYWTLGDREAGPFKSQSSAWRDAYYKLGRRKAPLLTSYNDGFERVRARPEVATRNAKDAAASTRRARLKVVA